MTGYQKSNIHGFYGENQLQRDYSDSIASLHVSAKIVTSHVFLQRCSGPSSWQAIVTVVEVEVRR